MELGRIFTYKLLLAAMTFVGLLLITLLYSDFINLFQGVNTPNPIPRHHNMIDSTNPPHFNENTTPVNHTSTSVSYTRHRADDSTISERFKERRMLLTEACKRPEIETRKPLDYYFKHRTQKVIFNRLNWCRIAKVGTTYILLDLEQPLNHWRETHEQEFQWESRIGAKSFVFVREPYSRLFSGYLDKILTTPSWWFTKLKHVAKFARPAEPEVCPGQLTFPEFVKYFIHAETTGEGRNVHFIPIHNQCDFCRINYDYIGHLETFSEDVQFILKSVGVDIPMVAIEESEISKKILGGFREGLNKVLQCTTRYKYLQSLWMAFHARGLIWDSLDLPVTEEQAEHVTPEQLEALALNMVAKYKNRFDKRQQRLQVMTRHYLSVPLEDRLKLREIFQQDFEMFQYEELPTNLFPEFQSMN